MFILQIEGAINLISKRLGGKQSLQREATLFHSVPNLSNERAFSYLVTVPSSQAVGYIFSRTSWADNNSNDGITIVLMTVMILGEGIKRKKCPTKWMPLAVFQEQKQLPHVGRSRPPGGGQSVSWQPESRVGTSRSYNCFFLRPTCPHCL